jgi:hypothetical protein
LSGDPERAPAAPVRKVPAAPEALSPGATGGPPPRAFGEAPRAAEAETVAVPRDAGVLRRGASVGRYLILSQLGRGSMGSVYCAYDPELDRRVAL